MIAGLIGFSAIAVVGLFGLIYGNLIAISSHNPLIQSLPLVNALLNSAATVCLCLGLAAILKKRVNCHRLDAGGIGHVVVIFGELLCVSCGAWGYPFFGPGLDSTRVLFHFNFPYYLIDCGIAVYFGDRLFVAD